MNRLGIGTYHTTHPSKWDECSPAQVAKLALLVLGEDYRNWVAHIKNEDAPVHESNAEYYHLRLQAMHILLRSYRKPLLMWHMLRTMRPHQYVDYLNHPDKPVDWVFVGGPTKNPWPTLRPFLFGPTYHGPADGMRDMTVYEFLTCSERYGQWKQTHSMKWVDEMIELLWRPMGPQLVRDGAELPRKRTEVGTWTDVANRHGMKAHAGWAATLNDGVRLAVLLWWQGNLKAMSERYTTLYGGEGRKRKSDPREVILRIAGSPKSQDVEAAATALIHNLMADMNRQMREDNEAEARRVRR